jgi:hypothetical protein
MAVSVKLGATAEVGLPHKLFDTMNRLGLAIGQYSVASDGSRFLMVEPRSAAQAPESSPLFVVINWASALTPTPGQR